MEVNMVKKDKLEKKIHLIDRLPEHQSAVRALMTGTSRNYCPLTSLEAAKSYDDGVVILEGDDGGQIYVVCPAQIVNCSEHDLEGLLRRLDEIAWPGNPPNSANIFYERLPINSIVAGGQGGGLVTEGIWIHEDLRRQGLEAEIRSTIEGAEK